MSCGIEETQLGPRAAGSRQASDRALDDQAAGAQHISLSEARRRVPASSAPHRKQLAGAEHGLCQIRPVENSKPFRCPRDWPPKTREPRPVARRARGSRVVILPGRILLRRAPLAERTRTKRRWFRACPPFGARCERNRRLDGPQGNRPPWEAPRIILGFVPP